MTYDQLNQPFLDPPGVVGVTGVVTLDPDGVEEALPSAESLGCCISCRSLSFVSVCICFSYSLTSLIVILYQSSIQATACLQKMK